VIAIPAGFPCPTIDKVFNVAVVPFMAVITPTVPRSSATNVPTTIGVPSYETIVETEKLVVAPTIAVKLAVVVAIPALFPVSPTTVKVFIVATAPLIFVIMPNVPTGSPTKVPIWTVFAS
jgi:hypothetical protein